MVPTNNPHTITDEEINLVKALGFEITSGTKSAADFLNDNFPGLQLFTFLKDLDDLLAPLATKPVKREIAYFETEPEMVTIQFYAEDSNDENNSLALSRTIIRYHDEVVAEHDFFVLPSTARKLGNGKKVLNYGLQQYLRIGVDKIRIYAALEDGGYVWAKASFAATKQAEVKVILEKAENDLQPERYRFVKRIYDNYYDKNPDGKAFPIVKWSALPGMESILRKSKWHGEIDLNNTEHLTKFKKLCCWIERNIRNQAI
jgi:hypothetical protein